MHRRSSFDLKISNMQADLASIQNELQLRATSLAEKIVERM
ncbi:MAG TPA: hypothetical protein VMW01_02345 [Williamwhitmania sp.]|nr:hypothetical protein [Williamwhitmania sp.]